MNSIVQALVAEAGLAVDNRGFVLVNATLQSVSHPDVCAARDVAAVAPYPRAKDYDCGAVAVEPMQHPAPTAAA